jgi:membrane protein implicated in regulation of membrane protease activity
MNSRILPVILLSLAFLFSLVSLASVPWNIISTWEIATLIFSVLIGFATVLVAYYVYHDYENAEVGFDTLKNRIERLEGIVDDNFDLVTDKLKKLEEAKEKK